MQPTTQSLPLKKLAVLAGVLLILLAGYLVYASLQFRVTKTSPNSSAFPSSLSTMEIHFNQKLDVESLKQRIDAKRSDVVSFEFESNATVTVAEKKLTVRFHQTPLAGKYSVNLINITAASGDTVTKELPFIVKDIPYDKLSEEEQKQYNDMASFAADDFEEDTDPLLKVIPYETNEYQINYGQPSQDSTLLKIIITMKFFAPGNNAKPATPAQTAAYLDQLRIHRKAALDYLASKNISTADYPIEYTELELRSEFPAGKAF